jgi:hypothetical protein
VDQGAQKERLLLARARTSRVEVWVNAVMIIRIQYADVDDSLGDVDAII